MAMIVESITLEVKYHGTFVALWQLNSRLGATCVNILTANLVLYFIFQARSFHRNILLITFLE